MNVNIIQFFNKLNNNKKEKIDRVNHKILNVAMSFDTLKPQFNNINLLKFLILINNFLTCKL